MSLNLKKIKKKAALSGILSGGIIVAFWPFVNYYLDIITIPPIIPAFIISTIFIYILNKK